MKDILDILNNWNGKTNERQKLQHAYLFITVVVVLASGIISLINPDTGNTMVKVALFAIGAFLGNAVVWSLLSSVLLARLTTRGKR